MCLFFLFMHLFYMYAVLNSFTSSCKKQQMFKIKVAVFACPHHWERCCFSYDQLFYLMLCMYVCLCGGTYLFLQLQMTIKKSTSSYQAVWTRRGTAFRVSCTFGEEERSVGVMTLHIFLHQDDIKKKNPSKKNKLNRNWNLGRDIFTSFRNP